MWVIRGRVFFRGQLEPLSVGIDEDGRVAAIKKVLRGDEEIDVGFISAAGRVHTPIIGVVNAEAN